MATGSASSTSTPPVSGIPTPVSSRKNQQFALTGDEIAAMFRTVSTATTGHSKQPNTKSSGHEQGPFSAKNLISTESSQTESPIKELGAAKILSLAACKKPVIEDGDDRDAIIAARRALRRELLGGRHRREGHSASGTSSYCVSNASASVSESESSSEDEKAEDQSASRFPVGSAW